MDIVTVDFETFYDQDYSLSKMTTEEYIRDPRFEVIGVSVKLNKDAPVWYSGEYPGRFLRSMHWGDKAVLSHNARFDAAILAWKFNIQPKMWLDSLSMARPVVGARSSMSLKALAEYFQIGVKGDEVLHAKGMRRADFTPAELARYAEYCMNDTDLAYQIFRKLARTFPRQEMILIDLVIRMFTEPAFELDHALLTDHLAKIRREKHELLATLDLGETLEETKKTLMSNKKFADLLLSLDVQPPRKISPTTGKETWAFAKTDPDILALQDHENPVVAAVVSARLGVKSTIEETRTERFIGIAERGTLPVALNYFGAHTGRFSGGDKQNLQNLPRTSPIRDAILAPPGHKLVICDLSQIEARMVAWLAGQRDLTEAFAAGRDVYSEFASEVYWRKITKADKTERFVGKVSILSLQYGVGAAKFRKMLGLGGVNVSEEEAKRIVHMYRSKYDMIPKLWRQCTAALDGITRGVEGVIGDTLLTYDANGILLPSGFTLPYLGLTRTERGFSYCSDARAYKKYRAGDDDGLNNKIYGAAVLENCSQALARIVMTEHMLKIRPRYRVLLQVHDEVIVLAHQDGAEEAKAFVEGVMSTPPVWGADLPVACEAGLGDTYGAGH